MKELENLYNELLERQDYLKEDLSNRRSPYMMARLDENRLMIVRVQQLLLEARFNIDTE